MCAHALAELIAACTSRTPSPNDKLVRNVCTMACGDPAHTPLVTAADLMGAQDAGAEVCMRVCVHTVHAVHAVHLVCVPMCACACVHVVHVIQLACVCCVCVRAHVCILCVLSVCAQTVCMMLLCVLSASANYVHDVTVRVVFVRKLCA